MFVYSFQPATETTDRARVQSDRSAETRLMRGDRETCENLTFAMPRNAEVIRQWTILREIERSRAAGVTIDDLASQCAVTTRTFCLSERRPKSASQAALSG